MESGQSREKRTSMAGKGCEQTERKCSRGIRRFVRERLREGRTCSSCSTRLKESRRLLQDVHFRQYCAGSVQRGALHVREG